jgi:hypothetical protein
MPRAKKIFPRAIVSMCLISSPALS